MQFNFLLLKKQVYQTFYRAILSKKKKVETGQVVGLRFIPTKVVLLIFKYFYFFEKADFFNLSSPTRTHE